jgi:hypothetical protein
LNGFAVRLKSAPFPFFSWTALGSSRTLPVLVVDSFGRQSRTLPGNIVIILEEAGFLS